MVYGVGPKTAKKWYSLGFRTADDVKNRFSQLDVNNTMITYGIFRMAWSQPDDFNL